MKTRIKRLETLERASGLKGGWDINKSFHVMIVDEGGSYEEALAEYRARNPDKTIAADHNVMWWLVVAPQRDETGRVIPRQKEDKSHAPSLADVLAGHVQ